MATLLLNYYSSKIKLFLVQPGIVLSITKAIISNIAISNSVLHFNTVVTPEILWCALRRYRYGENAGTVTKFKYPLGTEVLLTTLRTTRIKNIK